MFKTPPCVSQAAAHRFVQNKVHKHMRGRDKAAKRAAKKQEKKHLQSRDVRRKDIQQSKPKPASGGEASDSVLDRFKRKDT